MIFSIDYSLHVVHSSLRYTWYLLCFLVTVACIAFAINLLYLAHVLNYKTLPYSLPLAYVLMHADNIILQTLFFFAFKLYAHFN